MNSVTRTVQVGNISIGSQHRIILIAGPCVIEDEAETISLAKDLFTICKEKGIPLIFKSSYDKANRSCLNSYRGPGIRQGLAILQQVKEKLGIPVLSDVHCRQEVDQAAKVLDVIQIPAFLCRQTDLLMSAGQTGKVINVKKGQFLAPWDVRHVVEKISSTGNQQILITERGTCFGYNQLVSDFRALPIMRNFGYPVIYDATHSVQQPGGLGVSSGGQREFVAPLVRAAVAVGCDGIFLEVHREPGRALSDGPNMVPIAELPSLLQQILKIRKALENEDRENTSSGPKGY